MNKLEYNIKLTTKDIWIFSLYNANRLYLGIFNLLFTIASIYFLFSSWDLLSNAKRILYIVCALMFTVIQPAMLYLKAAKQAKTDAIKKGFKIVMTDETIKVIQGEAEYETAWDTVYKTFISKMLIVIYFAAFRGYLLPARYIKESRIELETLLKEKTKVVKF